MEPSKRVAPGGTWDRLPEETVSMIAAKVAETLVAPLEDIHSLCLCNKATKRASSSSVIVEHHYQSMMWGDGDTRAAYLQTIDWLVGASNGGALFV
jgi:hypothetical protein